ncbi:transcriptional regulator, AraC family [Arcobacter nitrofigilis DSM 7299]|uniref:Transcriptional regulator, AraC family n=1 Tax=Arcobacter nitrofigilis (strain ATCC 33309 / DSM 7299 / CCUG 15893 / LMG 7604 / NCTC 12251 / CI) TaxID=572480 RepID=D5V2T4_ARCNC|nr:AraC family transcriptional regulator [Arcobacter nitrofigilis]ADG92516.1 transcriptional regulator, AraC family [Arcobacter nitrofigilis DSM 7299]
MKLETLNKTIFENIHHSNGEFSKHFHNTYTIGLTHDGIFKSRYEKKIIYSYKQSSKIINPGEVHGGDSNSWKYTNFYPSIELVSEVYEQIFLEKKIPIFTEHIINDINLYNLLLNFFISIYSNVDKMIVETNMINALSYLIKNYADMTKDYDYSFNNKEIIKNSISYIKDSLETNISLDDLAANSNLSKYHFLRVFRNNTGITPHKYILIQRIEKSKDLILKGMNISSAAYSTGFSDQSHLIRSFKKVYGYTPNDFKQNSNFVL